MNPKVTAVDIIRMTCHFISQSASSPMVTGTEGSCRLVTWIGPPGP